MSAARILDDLARTLAEPMPRRRLLRVLGSSIAAVTVPTLGAQTARAARTVGSATCGEDERTCRKGAEAQFAEYCCPAPSWRWFCGGQDNQYKCINQCAGQYAFPCTGLKPDQYSGVNGVCCDSRYHAKCDQDTLPRLSGGGSRPSCVPKVCGPDITDALVDVLSRVEARFAGLGIAKRGSACTSLVTLPASTISWDIIRARPGR